MDIAELFYPKELKNIIADLRAKNDLNEQVIKNLRFTPYFYVGLWLLGALCIALFNFSDWVVILQSISALAFFLLACLFLGRRDTFSRIKTYHIGTKRTGIVKSIYYIPYQSTVKIKVEDSITGKFFFMGLYHEWHGTSERPKVGEEMHYYSIGKSMRHNMPDRIEIKKHYCLSKSMLQENKE